MKPDNALDEYLLARIAEDEEDARRELAECEFKRQVVEQHKHPEYRELAAIYARRHDYPDRCVLCGARAVRDAGSSIAAWAVRPGLNGFEEHEHLING